MKVTVEFMVEEVSKLNQQINELANQRTQFINTYQKVILKSICSIMAWSEDEIAHYKIEYSSFEKRIMIEVFLKKERFARYVFEIGKSAHIMLRFREVMF